MGPGLIGTKGEKRKIRPLHRSKVPLKKDVDMFEEEKDATQCCRLHRQLLYVPCSVVSHRVVM